MAEQANAATATASNPPGYATLAAGLERLNAVARADSTVGAPRQLGDHMVIPLADVFFGSAFGVGGGSAAESSRTPGSGMGGGAGFGGRVRPVAVVEVGPDGVRVRPVFDASAIGLALVTVGLATLLRLWRRPDRRT
jgi:uncharacterized spore protein YtfJ